MTNCKFIKKTGGLQNIIFFKRYINETYHSLGKKPSRRKREQTKRKIQNFAFGAGTLIGFMATGPFAINIAIALSIILVPFFAISLRKINNGTLNSLEKEKEKLYCEYIVGTFAGFLCSIWLFLAMLYLGMFPFFAVLTLLCVAFVIVLIIFANRNKLKFKSQTNKEATENMLWGMICALGCEISTQLGYISLHTTFGIITFGDIFGFIFFVCMFSYLIKFFRK